MIAFILDSNIYNLLEKDKRTCDLLRAGIDAAKWKVIITRTIREELAMSRFGGLPTLFNVEYTGNTVAKAGIMCAGDSLGGGEVFTKHMGDSKKMNDALIVDAADWKADFLVSNDRRLIGRMKEASKNCKAMAYEDFVSMIANFSNLQ